MSIWRVTHSYSRVVEASLIALALAYGIFAIYLASLRPLVVALTADIRNVPEPVSLDTDAWQRATNVSERYLFGVPIGWRVSSPYESRVEVSRAGKTSISREVIVIETKPIGDRNQVENIAADDFVGSRPALYDVAVHGRPGLFAVAFDEGRIVRQSVYVQVGERMHVFQTGAMDPAAFSTFISTVKFLPETPLLEESTSTQ